MNIISKPHQKHSLVWTIPFSLSILSILGFCVLVITEKSGQFVGAADIFCEANHVHIGSKAANQYSI